MNLDLFEAEDLLNFISFREGEKKIGESLCCGGDYFYDDMAKCSANFVIIGIPEDIGPRANEGLGGANSAWLPFLRKFLNIQESKLLSGSDIAILGSLDCSGLVAENSTDLTALREAVAQIDETISTLLVGIVKAGKIPIIIGGGHNNCFPLIKACSLALKQKINAVNLDPHADFRILEGRHSGNGFSYAKAEGYLNKYHVIGLQENYNSQEMLKRMALEEVSFSSFEDIFVREELSFQQAIAKGKKVIQEQPYGIELDMDSIQGFPSSAQSPSGVSANQARYYLSQLAQSNHARYLHLPEAAPSLVAKSEDQVGKLLAFLVSDFIKARSQNAMPARII